MLRSTDLENLFPHFFGPAQTEIARWEDDGGSRIGGGSFRSTSHFNLIDIGRASCTCADADGIYMALTVAVVCTAASDSEMLAPFGDGSK
ncbi:hypothetical protein [Cypionkella psychrotolerans]|uniref:hypothetical protein n=1 Tax=Cypionkella psychrotolerans TaxID=1678131 RepID=UPI0006B6187A|nr:hypothetical protein [Cypionkella psychrotolerans]